MRLPLVLKLKIKNVNISLIDFLLDRLRLKICPVKIVVQQILAIVM